MSGKHEKSRKKTIIKVVLTLLAVPILLFSLLILSFVIQYNSDGKYNIFGPLPRLNIKLSQNIKYDFIIEKGVWFPQEIEFYSKTNSDELLWKLNYFYDRDSDFIKYLNYGIVPVGNVFQVYPNVGVRNGDLSLNEEQTANEVSRNSNPPRKLNEGEIVIVKISSYCGNSFEQPNCRETREFIYSMGKFVLSINR